MATYNGAAFVEEQVLSILAQTNSDWRLSISDDCSTDGTLEVLDRLEKKDARIRVVSKNTRHGGSTPSFMWLLNNSTASYVMFCDQDDVWLPDKIEKTLSKMYELEASHGANSPLLVFSDLAVVDAKLELIASSYAEFKHRSPMRIAVHQLLSTCAGNGCTMMLNRTLSDMCCSVLEYGEPAFHDWWALLVASACGHIGYVDESLMLYRQHLGNVVGAQRYSFFAAPRHANARIDELNVSCQQADYLLRFFRSRLSEIDARHAEEYVAIVTCQNPVGRLRHLFASHAWKRGTKGKLGQIDTVLRMTTV